VIEIQWEGIEQWCDMLDQLDQDFLPEISKEVDNAGEHLLAQSKKLCPVLTGDLMRSGTKTPVRVVGSGASVDVGFHKIYGARRHEEVYNPGPITQSKPTVDGMVPGRKYLENPLLFYTPQYYEAFAKIIRAAIERITP